MTEPSSHEMPLPGGIGVSRLTVYGTEAPDGLVGGSAHVHLACTEGYVVTSGAGRVQVLTLAGFYEIDLRPGAVVWFTPGTIHRLVNDDGALEIVTLMQNAGLPEAGDAVLTFPPSVLEDAERYDAVARVTADADGLAQARKRRDLAIDGFTQLRRQVEAGDRSALEAFYARAVTLRRGLVDDWRRRWEEQAVRATGDTEHWLAEVAAGRAAYLQVARVAAHPEPSAAAVPGMCGTLATYADPAPRVVSPVGVEGPGADLP